MGAGFAGAWHSGECGESGSKLETPGLGGLVPEEQRQGLYDALAAQVPLGRIGEPAEVGKAVAFLASDAGFINVVELFVDGGMAQILRLITLPNLPPETVRFFKGRLASRSALTSHRHSAITHNTAPAIPDGYYRLAKHSSPAAPAHRDFPVIPGLIRLCKACDHHQRRRDGDSATARTAFLFVGQLSVLINLMSRNAAPLERPVKQIRTIPSATDKGPSPTTLPNSCDYWFFQRQSVPVFHHPIGQLRQPTFGCCVFLRDIQLQPVRARCQRPFAHRTPGMIGGGRHQRIRVSPAAVPVQNAAEGFRVATAFIAPDHFRDAPLEIGNGFGLLAKGLFLLQALTLHGRCPTLRIYCENPDYRMPARAEG